MFYHSKKKFPDW